jgi:hypothetical protein
MPIGDLSRGVYTGQFLPVCVEPKTSPGAYDQEIFLITHEWDAYLNTEEEEEASDSEPPLSGDGSAPGADGTFDGALLFQDDCRTSRIWGGKFLIPMRHRGQCLACH